MNSANLGFQQVKFVGQAPVNYITGFRGISALIFVFYQVLAYII